MKTKQGKREFSLLLICCTQELVAGGSAGPRRGMLVVTGDPGYTQQWSVRRTAQALTLTPPTAVAQVGAGISSGRPQGVLGKGAMKALWGTGQVTQRGGVGVEGPAVARDQMRTPG